MNEAHKTLVYWGAHLLQILAYRVCGTDSSIITKFYNLMSVPIRAQSDKCSLLVGIEQINQKDFGSLNPILLLGNSLAEFNVLRTFLYAR